MESQAGCQEVVAELVEFAVLPMGCLEAVAMLAEAIRATLAALMVVLVGVVFESGRNGP